MENKIILGIIKKDIDELKLLVESLQEKEFPEQLLIDITVSKARILLQEFELLKGNHHAVEPIVVQKDIEIAPPIIEQEAPLNKEINADKEKIAIELEEPEKIEEVLIIDEEPVIEELVEVLEEKITTFGPDEVVEPIITEEPLMAAEEVKKEEEPEHINKKILGENFTKEPSLHERLSSGKDQTSKIKGKPVTQLKTAIGLNDKFQYTRELFDNSSEKFTQTIDALDKASDLIEAVEYLEQHFKWIKNETSLKFMELVKKRFEK